ncbi:MAG: substrate-binding domain-containing protein [Cyanobacteria bacterium P01_A01_bin.116]
MSQRKVAYIMPLPPGLHPGMDAIAHGLAHGLKGTDTDLRILPADLRAPNFTIEQNQAVVAATEAKVDGICLFVLDEQEPAPAVWRAMGKNIPVIAIHKPVFPVTATIAVPNFYHGLFLTQLLARRVGVGARVVIIGGPPILDDDEMVEGLLAGAKRCKFNLLNNPHDPVCRNMADVAGAGADAVCHVLDTYTELDALIVFNDETLIDVLPLLKEQGLLGTLPVVSRNGSPAAVAAVKRGDSLATYDYGLPEMGLAAGNVFKDIFLNGSGLEDEIVCPTYGCVIDEDAAGSYVPWEKRAPAVELITGLD